MSASSQEPKDRNMSMNFDLIINFVCDVGAECGLRSSA